MVHLISTVLAVAVFALGQSMAVAMDGPAPVGAVMICTGGVSVTVDAEGRPTGLVHGCPDCTPAVLASHAAPHIVDPGHVVVECMVPSAGRSVAHLVLATVPLARGPPVPV